jgi:hypothetical protein
MTPQRTKQEQTKATQVLMAARILHGLRNPPAAGTAPKPTLVFMTDDDNEQVGFRFQNDDTSLDQTEWFNSWWGAIGAAAQTLIDDFATNPEMTDAEATMLGTICQILDVDPA